MGNLKKKRKYQGNIELPISKQEEVLACEVSDCNFNLGTVSVVIYFFLTIFLCVDADVMWVQI